MSPRLGSDALPHPEAPGPLRRHQLALLSGAGWQRLLAGNWDAPAQECLAHWSQQGLPLVVARQPSQPGDLVHLGLPAPGRWRRRRIATAVTRQEIVRFDAFPELSRVAMLLPQAHRGAWRALAAALAASSATARVYGSHGWQVLTGLDHLRPGSDIDLCIAVDSPEQADAVATSLQAWPAAAPRLDGELLFADGSAVAWREWSAWRQGRAACVLVKRIDGVALAFAPFWRAAETA